MTASNVELHPPPIGRQNPGRFAHLYGVLTVQEMADHLKCSPKAVYERAVAGESSSFLRRPESMAGVIPRFSSVNAWTSRC